MILSFFLFRSQAYGLVKLIETDVQWKEEQASKTVCRLTFSGWLSSENQRGFLLGCGWVFVGECCMVIALTNLLKLSFGA